MRKLVLATLIVALAADLGFMMSEIRAHKKYKKGYVDGANFAFALKDLEETLKDINDEHTA